MNVDVAESAADVVVQSLDLEEDFFYMGDHFPPGLIPVDHQQRYSFAIGLGIFYLAVSRLLERNIMPKKSSPLGGRGL